MGLVFFPGNSVLELNLCEKRIHNFCVPGFGRLGVCHQRSVAVDAANVIPRGKTKKDVPKVENVLRKPDFGRT